MTFIYYCEFIDLPGIEIVGSTLVTITNSAQSFYWPGFGFRITVSPDSLPVDVDRCELRISASLSGQYQLPENEELVSAIFWVRPDPLCRFQQKMTVEIQHCAKMTNSTNLTFVRAICSQESLPYTFKKLDGRGSFSEQSSYGSLELDHFSGIGITGDDFERTYIASFYNLSRNPWTVEVHFVIFWDDEAHYTVSINLALTQDACIYIIANWLQSSAW